jgi:hypothetical protein
MTSERVPESVTFGVADQDGHGRAGPARWLAHNTAQLAWRVACRVARAAEPEVYARDGVISTHRHAFMDDPLFQRAYHRGVRAIGGEDRYRWQWRVHIGLWTATNASRLEGDFVECGVNQGFLSSAVMEALDWDTQGKTFYLLDTFAGLDPRFISAVERDAGALEDSEKHLRDGFYVDSVDSVRANFAQWLDSGHARPGRRHFSRLPAHRHELCSARSCCDPALLAASITWRLRATRRLCLRGLRGATVGHGRLCSRGRCADLCNANRPRTAHQTEDLARRPP